MNELTVLPSGLDQESPPGDPDRPELAGPDYAAEFERLFQRHADRLRSYLTGRVGAVAEDLLAETFLTALHQRDAYDQDRGTAKSWLFGIATHLIHRYHRREAQALKLLAKQAGRAQDHLDHGARVADAVDAQAQVRQVADGLRALNQGDRDVLLLTSWGGLSGQEAAEALGIPIGTVHSRLNRVRKRLRKLQGEQ